MKTLQLTLTALCMLLVQMAKAQTAFGEIRGLIKDEELEPMIGAVVKITQGGYLIGGTTTDVNGKYVYKPLNPGQYDLIVTSTGYGKVTKLKINVAPGEATYVDVKMAVNALEMVEVFVAPLVDLQIARITSIGADEYASSSAYGTGLSNVVTSLSAEVFDDGKGVLHFRGARQDASEYLIDGIKVSSLDGIPNQAIENISVITGGVPAMYGDLSSGVIAVTTKDYFSGIRSKEIRNREFREKQEELKKQRAEKAQDDRRKKEIEEEKKKEKQGN
ncbi:MAG: carboxypeptidase regulatory-like domain-containing protein [Bacteroidia bacterium]